MSAEPRRRRSPPPPPPPPPPTTSSAPSLPFDLLARAYTDLALPEKGLQVFSLAKGANLAPKIESCNSPLSALVKANQIEKAWILDAAAMLKPVEVDVFAFDIMINALCEEGMLGKAKAFNASYGELGDSASCCLPIVHVCKQGVIDDASMMFDEMLQRGLLPNVVTCSTLIDRCCYEGKIEEAKAIIRVMESVLLRWNEIRYGRKDGLPPGTMGWPLLGETTEFLKHGPDFMKTKRNMHGNIFKTHILGYPTIICMDAELNRSIIRNEGKSHIIPGYPQPMLDLLGEWNIAAVNGSLHKAMRSCMLGLISLTMIRDQLLTKIDAFMRSVVKNWDGQVIDIQEKMKEMWLSSILKQIINIDGGSLAKTLEPEIMKLVLGTLSLPIRVPGTNYYQGIQARKKVVKILGKIIQDRRASLIFNNDLLDALLKNNSDEQSKLSDEQIIDLLITLIYSGFETVSTTSMMAIKYLHDHPKVLEECRKEQLEVRKIKMLEDAITWDEYKSMNFTRAVIFETLRLATVVNGVLRKTTREMEMKGFLVPKDWRIYVYMREMNYDPFTFPDPFVFDPWRWMDKNMELNSLAFGGGGRLCPGKELGTVMISVFLHYFVINYRWKALGEEIILKFPRVEAPNGLHFSIRKY